MNSVLVIIILVNFATINVNSLYSYEEILKPGELNKLNENIGYNVKKGANLPKKFNLVYHGRNESSYRKGDMYVDPDCEEEHSSENRRINFKLKIKKMGCTYSFKSTNTLKYPITGVKCGGKSPNGEEVEYEEKKCDSGVVTAMHNYVGVKLFCENNLLLRISVIDLKSMEITCSVLILDSVSEETISQTLPPSVKNFELCPNSCGITNEKKISKRLGPYEADIREFPWQVLITSIIKERVTTLCGGAILNSRFVITTANCLLDEKRIETIAIIGISQLEKPGSQIMPAERVFIHPAYRKTDLLNDIALIALESQIKWTPEIRSICLPGPREDFTGKSVITSGFGENLYERGHSEKYSRHLAKTETTLLPIEQCQSYFSMNIYNEKRICTKGFFNNLCNSAAGSPLIHKNSKDRYILVGVGSFMKGCMSPTSSLVASKVPRYIHWIRNTILRYKKPATCGDVYS